MSDCRLRRDQPPSASSTRGKLPRSASIVHGIVIEARLVRRKSLTTDATVQHGRGVLLGQIEVQERVGETISHQHCSEVDYSRE